MKLVPKQNVIEHDPSFFDEDENMPNTDNVAMTDDDILGLCSAEIAQSAGYDTDELISNRTKALDYYFGRPRGDELEGRSKAQSMDVADMIEATLAEIMPLFSTPNVASFSALYDGDESQAKLESKFCNHQFMEVSGGWTVLYQTIKDSLLQKNGLVDVFVHEEKTPKFKSYEKLTQFELAQAFNIDDDNTEVVEWDENDDCTFNITLRKYMTTRKLMVEPIAPEDFLFAINHHAPSTKDMRFCARRIIATESELISQGHDPEVIASLASYTENTNTDSTARNQVEDEDDYDSTNVKYIETFKCYIMMDYDGDGIDELHRVLIAGGENGIILEREWVNFISFASGSPFLMSHRFIGLSLFDKLENTQDQKTFFIRQWHDNANVMNNRRLEVVENQVNMEDVLNSRPGGAVRTKMKGVVTPIPVDDIGPSCAGALEYLDKVRSERGGASLDMQTSEMIAGTNVGSQGVDRQYASKEKMAALIARTLAETLVKEIYVLIHANMREYMDGMMEIPVEDQWLKTDPSKWLQRNSVKIDIGMSKGERSDKVRTLMSTIEMQKQTLEMGGDGVLTSTKKVHNAIIDASIASGLSNPERYWIDPDSPESKQARKQREDNMAKQAEEAKKMQFMSFEQAKKIEAQKDKVAVFKEQSKQHSEKQNWVYEMIQHNDNLMKDYTALEAQYAVDVPGKGAGDTGNQGGLS